MNKLLIVFGFITSVRAHLVLNIPQVWGISDSVSLEQPLDATTQNYVCAGRTPPSNAGVVQLVAGRSYSFNTVCGEINLGTDGCLTGDWHTGNSLTDYSGCALSVSYSDYRTPANHKYISYTQECPKYDTPTSFRISENVENCERCVCSWAWAPSRDFSSPGQFYHNCFYCSISGGRGNRTSMRTLDFINVNNAGYNDITYNDIRGLNNIYNVVTSSTTTYTSTTSTSTATRSPTVTRSPTATTTTGLSRPTRRPLTRTITTTTPSPTNDC